MIRNITAISADAYPVSASLSEEKSILRKFSLKFPYYLVLDKDFLLSADGMIAFCEVSGLPFLVSRASESSSPNGGPVNIEVISKFERQDAEQLLEMNWRTDLAPLGIYVDGAVLEGCGGKVAAYASHREEIALVGFRERGVAESFASHNDFPYMSADYLASYYPRLASLLIGTDNSEILSPRHI